MASLKRPALLDCDDCENGTVSGYAAYGTGYSEWVEHDCETCNGSGKVYSEDDRNANNALLGERYLVLCDGLKVVDVRAWEGRGTHQRAEADAKSRGLAWACLTECDCQTTPCETCDGFGIVWDHSGPVEPRFVSLASEDGAALVEQMLTFPMDLVCPDCGPSEVEGTHCLCGRRAAEPGDIIDAVYDRMREEGVLRG